MAAPGSPGTEDPDASRHPGPGHVCPRGMAGTNIKKGGMTGRRRSLRSRSRSRSRTTAGETSACRRAIDETVRSTMKPTKLAYAILATALVAAVPAFSARAQMAPTGGSSNMPGVSPVQAGQSAPSDGDATAPGSGPVLMAPGGNRITPVPGAKPVVIEGRPMPASSQAPGPPTGQPSAHSPVPNQLPGPLPSRAPSPGNKSLLTDRS
jgi:hypothetical protein